VAEPWFCVKRASVEGRAHISKWLAMSTLETLQLAVSVALRRGDALLLVQRANEPAKGQWAFAGGRVEADEPLEAAARRELLEETGLKAGELSQLCTMELGRFLLTVFVGDALDGNPVANDDAAAVGFFVLDQILNMNATASTKSCATMVLKRSD
jgi:8-oxo-dGTP diphosphatase